MRLHTPLCLLLAALTLACGGPVDERLTQDLQLRRLAPGGYLGGCLSGDQLLIARADQLERWALSGPAPRRVGRVDLGSVDRGRLTGLGCSADPTSAQIGGRAWAVKGDQLVPSDAAPPTTLQTGEIPLEGARRLWIAPSGWGLLEGQRRLGWRVGLGGIAEAALHEGALWLVGEGGAWRWRLDGRAALPVPLPAGLAGRPLTGIFRGDGRLWLRDADGVGWPTRYDGMSLRLEAPPGPLRPQPTTITLYSGAGRLEGARGAPLKLIKKGAPPVTLIERMGAYLPLSPGVALLTSEAGVELWRLDGAPRRVRAWRLGGATVGIFVEGERLLFVGRDYGIVEGRFIKKAP